MSEYVKRQAARIKLANADAERAHNTPPASPEKVTKMAAIGFRYTPQHDLLAVLKDAIVARGTHKTPSARLAPYADSEHLIADAAHACLMLTSRDRGLSSHTNGPEVIRLALTTGDFPRALGSASSRMVLDGYLNADLAYRYITQPQTFPDFKSRTVLNPAQLGNLQEVSEAGEVRFSTLTEQGEAGALSTYASGFVMARQALVNNDVQWFASASTTEGLLVADLEDRLTFATLTAGANSDGPILADGGQLFSTSRGNKASSGAAISATLIAEGRAAMAAFTSPDGAKGIVGSPKYLVCSPAQLGTAEVELGKLALGANPAQRIVPLASPHLSGGAWYLVADPKRLPALVIARLAGSETPIVVAMPDWETEGLRFCVSHDVAVVAVDPRGIFKNPGA